MHTDRLEAIGVHLRLCAAGDWERYAASSYRWGASGKLSIGCDAQVAMNLWLSRNWEVIGELQFSIDFSFHCRLGSAKTGSPYITGKSSEHAEGLWSKVSNALWFSGKG